MPFFADATSTATTGAWTSPASTAAAGSAAELAGAPPRGVHAPHHGPFRGPIKALSLQDKRLPGPGSVPFGGSNGLVCLLPLARSTATTGGMTFARSLGAVVTVTGCWGRRSAPMAPRFQARPARSRSRRRIAGWKMFSCVSSLGGPWLSSAGSTPESCSTGVVSMISLRAAKASGKTPST
jgi:hypothetical protein